MAASSNATDPKDQNKDQRENFDDVQLLSQKHVLEFRVSQIAGGFDVDTVANAIEFDLNNSPSDLVKIDSSQILGVVKYPQRWTQKILIYLDNEESKNDLLIRGLTLYNQHVELSELGLGPMKVIVQNADLFFDDEVIKQWLSQFGEITGFKHETHKLRNAKDSKWYTGNRIVWIKNVNKSIPPVAKLNSGDEVANISVWHYGQTEIKCRFCHMIVPKGHMCKRAPQKKCFLCGENDHVRADCPLNSYESNFPSIVAGHQNHPNKGKTPLKIIDPTKPLERSPRNDSPSDSYPKPKKQRTNSSGQLSFYDDVSNSESAEIKPSPSGRSTVKGTCETVVFTDANKKMELVGDDVLQLNNTMPVEDDMTIEKATEMLSNMSRERKQEVDVAVVHVGAQHFPTKTKEEFDNMIVKYQSFVYDVMDQCPKSSVVISSVLPRAGNGDFKTALNSCIDQFNQNICHFSKANERNRSRLHFLNNEKLFKNDEKEVVRDMYIDPDGEGVRITDESHGKLNSGIIDAIKYVFYQDKLVESQRFDLGAASTKPST